MSQFEEIAREALRKAERVSCPLSDFAEGLEEMIDILQERRDEVTGEMAEA